MSLKHIAAVLPTLFHELVEADLVVELGKVTDLDEIIISDALDALELKGVIAFPDREPGEPPGSQRIRFTCSTAELIDQIVCVVADGWCWELNEGEDTEDGLP